MPDPSARTRFNPRAFTSLGVALSAAGLPATGLANHLLQAEPLTRERHAWMSAHSSLGVVFVAFAVCHVWLNRRPLLNALRAAWGGPRGSGRELRCALALVAVVTALAVGHALVVP